MTDPNINASETFKPKVLEAESSKQPLKKQNNRLDFDETLKTSQKKIGQQDDSDSNNSSLLNSSIPWGQLQAIFQAKFDYRPDFSFNDKIKEGLSKNNTSFVVDASHNSNQGNFDSNEQGIHSQQGIADSKEAKNPVQELARMMSTNKSANPNFAVFVPFNELVRNMSKFTSRLEIKIIADKIIERARALKVGEKSELIIDLKPEWLGNITLNISSEKGLINVQIYAGENAKALLDQSLSELQDSLKEANINIGGLQVFVGNQQYGQGNNDGNSNTETGFDAEYFIKNITNPILYANSDISDYYSKMAFSWYSMGNKIFSKI